MNQFAIYVGVVVILLLNVMEVLSVGRGALSINRVWTSKKKRCFGLVIIVCI